MSVAIRLMISMSPLARTPRVHAWRKSESKGKRLRRRGRQRPEASTNDPSRISRAPEVTLRNGGDFSCLHSKHLSLPATRDDQQPSVWSCRDSKSKVLLRNSSEDRTNGAHQFRTITKAECCSQGACPGFPFSGEIQTEHPLRWN
jgi:hypothetical protein